jgi:hypothetical protein
MPFRNVSVASALSTGPENVMWIKTSLAALGIMGAMAVATPLPTFGQAVQFGAGDVGVVAKKGKRVRSQTRTTTTGTSSSLDGRTLGRMRTCGYDYLQYDGLGAPFGPYCH